jgi:UDP-glucose 4-epimerase
VKALVLGGNGFIGSHLVDGLLKNSWSVRVFDRMREKFRSPLSNVDYRFGEFDDTFAVAEALEGIDIVYHLINTTVPSTSLLNPVADIEENLIASVRLLEQMVKTGVKRIVFLSSGGTVYGNPETGLVSEKHLLRPICSYGIIKTAIENYLFMYHSLYGIRATVIRASNVYGPRQGHIGVQGLIGTFLHNVVNAEPLVVWGDGKVVRDYLFVQDIVNLCIIAGKCENAGTFNAGFGVGHSVRNIIDIISDIIGKKLEVAYQPARPYDVDRIVLDISKTKKTFGWNPLVSLDEGIKKYWQWLNRDGKSSKLER